MEFEEELVQPAEPRPVDWARRAPRAAGVDTGIRLYAGAPRGSPAARSISRMARAGRAGFIRDRVVQQ